MFVAFLDCNLEDVVEHVTEFSDGVCDVFVVKIGEHGFLYNDPWRSVFCACVMYSLSISCDFFSKFSPSPG